MMNNFWANLGRAFVAIEGRLGHDNWVYLCGVLTAILLVAALRIWRASYRVMFRQ